MNDDLKRLEEIRQCAERVLRVADALDARPMAEVYEEIKTHKELRKQLEVLRWFLRNYHPATPAAPTTPDDTGGRYDG